MAKTIMTPCSLVSTFRTNVLHPCLSPRLPAPPPTLNMVVTDLSETPATNYQNTQHHRLTAEPLSQDISRWDGSR